MTTATALPLFRTDGGGRLHIAPCYHIHGVPVLEATEDDRREMAVCTHCQAEIDGYGRTQYDDLDAALRAFGSYADTVATIKGLLADVVHDDIGIPYSGSYVSLGRDGRAVAWVGKTYVAFVDRDWVELPGYRPGGGGGAPVDQRAGDICPVHFLQMPVGRPCDDC